jgi:hypothetical protein
MVGRAPSVIKRYCILRLRLNALSQLMNIIEQYSPSELPLPKAVRVLQNLDSVPTFEAAYAARHPLAAYNISLTGIARRLIAVVDALDNIQQESRLLVSNESLPDGPLLEATDHLLDSLMEHMDVCNGIIRSFFAPADERNFKKALTTFKASVEPYRKHIGAIVNYMKHSQGTLRSVRFH